MIQNTKTIKVFNVVDALEVGQSFNKREFILSVWKRRDYFIDRSFDVFFSLAKKKLQGKLFKTEKGFIIRIQ